MVAEHSGTQPDTAGHSRTQRDAAGRSRTEVEFYVLQYMTSYKTKDLSVLFYYCTVDKTYQS